MLKTYYRYYTLYNSDGQVIRSDSTSCIREESEAVQHENIYTWDNISDFDSYSVEIISKRKGRVLKIYNWSGYCYWKEWKHDLKITERVSYRECNLSLDAIMKLNNSDLSIEYLKQRGMAVCPMR